MSQQPDKLFRDKLRGFEQLVSPEAWKRVSENIQGRKTRGLWLKVAAAVSLLALGTFLIYPLMRKTPPAPLVHNDTKLENKTSEPGDLKPESAEEASEVAPNAFQKSAPTIANQPPREKRIPRTKGAQKKQEVTPSFALEDRAPSDLPDHARTENIAGKADPIELVLETEPPIAIAAKEEKVTIIYTAEEVNKKYLAKNTEAEATPDKKETSGLKKLLDKAYDLKHNQDPLGDLRQKKNEILAMNFKSDKRTRND